MQRIRWVFARDDASRYSEPCSTLCVLRVSHVEPTPMQREPSFRPEAPSAGGRRGTHLACPGSHTGSEASAGWRNRREPQVPSLSSSLAGMSELDRRLDPGRPLGARPARRRGRPDRRAPRPTGSTRPLAGLTLLEAAAVGGDELAVDALANALGPVFRAAPTPARVAVAMSGGVDSAVALLRAGPDAIGVTLRLWLDPRGPGRRARLLLAGGRARRARHLPRARAAARDARPARGVPARGRRAVRRAATPRGETPNPCIRCNGSFRFAELLAFAEPRRRRAARDRPLRAHRRAPRAGCCSPARPTRAKDQSYMLARLDPRFLGRLWFPLGEQTKDETRAEAARAGLEAARRAESQEACFLAGGDYRDFLERHGLAAGGRRRSSTRTARELGRHGGFWRFTPGPAARASASPPASRSTRCAASRGRTPSSSARARALAASEVVARGRLHVPVERAEAKLRYRSPAVGATSSPTDGGFRLDLDAAGLRRRPGQAAVLYEGDAIVGIRHHRPRILSKPSRRPSSRLNSTGDDRRRDHAHHPARRRPSTRSRTSCSAASAARLNLSFEQPRRPRDSRSTPSSSGRRSPARVDGQAAGSTRARSSRASARSPATRPARRARARAGTRA